VLAGSDIVMRAGRTDRRSGSEGGVFRSSDMAPWSEQSIDLIWEWAADFLQPRHSRLIRMWAIKHRLTVVELNRHFFQRHVPEHAPPPPFP
jgi:hypothetical protein